MPIPICGVLWVHEGDSTALDGAGLKRLAGGAYRLVSIDGGHTAEATAHDLAIAVEALAPEGLIILDDYFNEMWPGVSEGVHRYFREPRGILPFATGANKTFFCAPGAIPLYVDSVRAIAVKTLEHDFLGARILCCDFAPLPFTERVGRDSRWHAVKDSAQDRSASILLYARYAQCLALAPSQQNLASDSQDVDDPRLEDPLSDRPNLQTSNAHHVLTSEGLTCVVGAGRLTRNWLTAFILGAKVPLPGAQLIGANRAFFHRALLSRGRFLRENQKRESSGSYQELSRQMASQSATQAGTVFGTEEGPISKAAAKGA